MLSDERVIVRQHDGQLWVYGTPWYGDAKIASPEAVPLERIFVIEHGAENQAVPLKPSYGCVRVVRAFISLLFGMRRVWLLHLHF